MTDHAEGLLLYINNTADVYHRHTRPRQEALARERAGLTAAKYSHANAVKMFSRVVASALPGYQREYDQGLWEGGRTFTEAEKRSVAEALASYFETEFDLGNFNHLLPPGKGAKKSGAQLQREINAALVRKRGDSPYKTGHEKIRYRK